MKTHDAAFREGRKERRLGNTKGDDYPTLAKLAGDIHCPDCGASYHAGRWTWRAAAPEAELSRCPACQRIAAGLPAGYVSFCGDISEQRRTEIFRLARNIEAREKAEHPLQRIMRFSDSSGHLLVTTTDGHLARAIAEGAHHAWKSTLTMHAGNESGPFRASVSYGSEEK
jgi:hypothetical protein